MRRLILVAIIAGVLALGITTCKSLSKSIEKSKDAHAAHLTTALGELK